MIFDQESIQTNDRDGKQSKVKTTLRFFNEWLIFIVNGGCNAPSLIHFAAVLLPPLPLLLPSLLLFSLSVDFSNHYFTFQQHFYYLFFPSTLHMHTGLATTTGLVFPPPHPYPHPLFPLLNFTKNAEKSFGKP